MAGSRDGAENVPSDVELQIEQFKQAVEQTAHAVYITDTDGIIEYVNPAFERITGYSAEEARGQKSSLLRSGTYDDDWYADLWETIQNGEQWEREMVDETKNGDHVVLEQTISPVSDESGEIKKFVAVAQDITTRKNQEHRLEAQRNDLEVLNQVLRHDIRNHLQLISAYGDMLEEYVDGEGEEYLTQVLDSTENAVALTQVAKEMAEVMLHQDSETTPMALAPVLNKEIEAVRSTHNTVALNVSSTIPKVEVPANSMLGSVFRNLLTNGIQHNDTAVPEISVSVEETPEFVTVRIADNGPGIPDAQKDEIFGKGEKGLDSPGSGIGLYLVQTLVNSYDGDVWVEDNESGGATFVVKLPVVS